MIGGGGGRDRESALLSRSSSLHDAQAAGGISLMIMFIVWPRKRGKGGGGL